MTNHELVNLVVFQFHKGTIRTLILLCVISSSVYFNSIKVQLERLKDSVFDLSVGNFNSIKVQLEPYYSAQQYLG